MEAGRRILAERVRFLSRALFAQPSLEALEECRA